MKQCPIICSLIVILSMVFPVDLTVADSDAPKTEEITGIDKTQDQLKKQVIQQLTVRNNAIKDIEVRYELIRICATSEYEKHGSMSFFRTAGETLFSDNLWRLSGMLEYHEETQMYELKRHSFIDGEYHEEPSAPVLDIREGSKPLMFEKLGFDGEKTVTYVEERRGHVEQPPMVRILEGKSERFDEFIDYKGFLFIPKVGWDIVDGSIDKGEFLGNPCIRFAIKESPKSTVVYHYWCDLSHAGTPVRIDKVIGGNIWSVYEVSELQQFGDGIWLPVNGIIHTFDKGRPSSVYLLNVKKLNINQGLKPKDFKVEYGEDVRIEDLTKNARLQTVLERLADIGDMILITDLYAHRLLQGITPKQLRDAKSQVEIIDILKNYQINVHPSSCNKDIFYVIDSSKKPPIETGDNACIEKLHSDIAHKYNSNMRATLELINVDIGAFCETMAKLTHREIVVSERIPCFVNVITGRSLAISEEIDIFDALLRLYNLDIQQTSNGRYEVKRRKEAQ